MPMPRGLNACITPDHNPLPTIEDLLQEVSGKIFSVMVFPITEKDVPKAAITPPRPLQIHLVIYGSLKCRSVTQLTMIRLLCIIRSTGASWTTYAADFSYPVFRETIRYPGMK